MSWIRSGNHIAIREGKKLAHLEAVDVYDAMEKGDLVFDGIHEGALESCFPDLVFSPVSLEARVILTSCADGIHIDVQVGAVSAEFVHGQMLDQIIDGDEWHYIENADQLKLILSKAGVTGCGCISISAYLSLINSGVDTGLVDNRVDAETLKKTLSYHNPAGLKNILFPYQKTGVAWIDYMLKNCHGCILGDEMGLGKTLQAIALLQEEKNGNGKSLVIAPVSLLDNWRNECCKFAPGIRVLLHHGLHRTGNPKVFEDYDVVVTSYGHAVTDNLLFSMRTWNLIVL